MQDSFRDIISLITRYNVLQDNLVQKKLALTGCAYKIAHSDMTLGYSTDVWFAGLAER